MNPRRFRLHRPITHPSPHPEADVLDTDFNALITTAGSASTSSHGLDTHAALKLMSDGRAAVDFSQRMAQSGG